MDVDSRVEEIVQGIVAQTLSDGQITDEEQQLIDQVKRLLKDLANYMLASEEDEKITEMEEDVFQRKKEDILGAVWRLANKDETITHDEEAVLGSLFYFLDELQMMGERTKE